MKSFAISDLSEGQSESFEFVISTQDVDAFASLTGDFSTIHMQELAAQEAGFETRVIHGALLTGAVSKLIGMYLPGETALIQKIQQKFHQPAYPGAKMKITGTVSQIVEAVKTCMIDFSIHLVEGGDKISSGKASVSVRESNS